MIANLLIDLYDTHDLKSLGLWLCGFKSRPCPMGKQE